MAHNPLISTLVLLMTIIKPQNSLSDCSVRVELGVKEANCYGLNLTEIPQTLDPDIAYLDISENFLKSIKRQDLIRYKEIWKFYYMHAKQVPTDKITAFEPKAFQDSGQMLILQLSGNILTEANLIYPENMTYLILQEAKLTDESVDFSYLKKLQTLSLKKNDLTKWPRLYKFAPLKTLDLLDNPIETFTAKKTARYCNLSYIGIDLNKIPSFCEDDCECHRMKEWMKMSASWLAIAGMRTATEFSCARSEPYCEDEPLITERMKLLNSNCLKGVKDESLDDGDIPRIKWKKLMKWAFIFVILVAMVFIIYRIYKMRQGSEGIAKLRTEATEIPSTTIEPEVPEGETQENEETQENGENSNF